MFTAPDEEPQKITLVLPLPTSLYLKWSPPALKHQNGKIIGYKVSWRLSQGQDSPSLRDTLLGTKNVTKTFVVIVNLNLSTSYEVRVAAFTAKGIGPYANIIVTTLNSKLEESRLFEGFTVG